jgi:hypothetical protein
MTDEREQTARGDRPPGWGKDKLTEFLDYAQHNTFATFVNFKGIFNRLGAIDTAFWKAIESGHNAEEWFSVFFLLRAHASYLGAVRLALSGEAAESYMVLRGCLENSLYGLHIYSKPDTAALWLKRDEGPKGLGKCKAEFTIANVFSSLKKADPRVSDVAHGLYDRAIEYGAHPNPQALLTNLRADDVENRGRKFTLTYLGGDSPSLRLCLKTTAQVGVCSLMIFRIVLKARFDILGISDDLEKLRRNL